MDVATGKHIKLHPRPASCRGMEGIEIGSGVEVGVDSEVGGSSNVRVTRSGRTYCI
jgi:hypothetical protein